MSGRILPALRTVRAAVLPTRLQEALLGVVVATTSPGPTSLTSAADELVRVLAELDPGRDETVEPARTAARAEMDGSHPDARPAATSGTTPALIT